MDREARMNNHSYQMQSRPDQFMESQDDRLMRINTEGNQLLEYGRRVNVSKELFRNSSKDSKRHKG